MSQQETIPEAPDGECQPPHRSPIAQLRKMGRAPVQAAAEHCELCGAVLAAEHPHLLEPQTRRILCSCPACALLMPERAGARFLAVPTDVRQLDDFLLEDAQWRGLNVPIELAFFVRREGGAPGGGNQAAFYPSPAGPTEAAVDPAAWELLVQRNPCMETFRSEVEALLVNRLFGQRIYFRVPIDVCFALTGLVRVHWRGLSGGTEVWKRVHAFFEALSARAGGRSGRNKHGEGGPDA